MFCVWIQKTAYYLCMLCLASVPRGGPAHSCCVFRRVKDSASEWPWMNLNDVDVAFEFIQAVFFSLHHIIINKSDQINWKCFCLHTFERGYENLLAVSCQLARPTFVFTVRQAVRGGRHMKLFGSMGNKKFKLGAIIHRR